MFNEVLKRRYEVLLRQRSHQIAELKKLVMKQEEELAIKEIEILNLQEKLKAPQAKKTQVKRTRQKRTKQVNKIEESKTDESKSTSN